MKVLVVNGSPKGPKSNTMQMTNAVLKGLKETNPEAEIELLTVKDMDIKPCMGCMSCWGKTAGQCVINDVSGKKFYVISSCGYGRTQEIYDALIKEFNFIYGKGRYQVLLCPQSEMFAIPPMVNQINEYLKRYTEIGKVMGKGEDIPQDMIDYASQPMIPQRALEKLMNNYWDAVTPENPLPAPNLR